MSESSFLNDIKFLENKIFFNFITEKNISINKGKINKRLKNFSSNKLIYFSIVSVFFSIKKDMSLLNIFLNIKLMGLASVK